MIKLKTAHDYLNWAIEILENKGIEQSRLDVELILADILVCQRVDLYLNKDRILNDNESLKFELNINRRSFREPVAYILGFKEFWSREIRVTKYVLIPRPETEGIVELACAIFKDSKTSLIDAQTLAIFKKDKQVSRDFDILDLCTGSGCIAAALASEFSEAGIVVTDISNAALNIAKENLSFAKNRVNIYEGDLFDALGNLEEHKNIKFDLITSNPPYISKEYMNTLPDDIKKYEPYQALEAGIDGLAISKRIVEISWNYLKPKGVLILEIGFDQGERLMQYCNLLNKYNFVKVIKDYSGLDRYLVMRAESR